MFINPNALPQPRIRKPVGDLPGRTNCFPHPPILKLDPDRLEFGKRDKDHDGTLSKEEVGQSKLGSLVFGEHDLDGDGKLTYDEFHNGREFDKMNGHPLLSDDVLTSDEYGTGYLKQAEFFRYDTNHDGKLTREEFAAGRARDRGSILHPIPLPHPLPWPEHPPIFIDKPPYIRKEGTLGDLVQRVKHAQEAKPE